MWSRCAFDGGPGEVLGMMRAVNLRMGIPGVGGEKGLSKKNVLMLPLWKCNNET